MSWFDTSGLASLAKTALKEAQKTIDKALDIKDEDGLTSSTYSEQPSVSVEKDQKPMKQSISNPALPSSSVWGSFSGSFFDNPNVNQMRTVTTPPTSLTKRDNSLDLPYRQQDTPVSGKDSQCESEQNSSESVEVMSSPTTPGSSLTSPGQFSCSTIQGSESVEVIGLNTPTSELATPDSVLLSTSCSELDSNIYPDSVEIISDENIEEEISLEEDSMSFDTVMESAIDVVDAKKDVTITTAPSRTSLYLSLDNSICELKKSSDLQSSTSSLTDAKDKEKKVPNLIDEAMRDKFSENSEAQTQLSDSTHSFEYIQQVSVPFERATSPNGSEERSDIVKITSSEHNSGHTSGDEIETTTSSDIEIISSPNGDSSSTNSVYKPGSTNIDPMTIAMKKKGHCRESSEASSHSIQSDDSRFSYQSETEKLLRRISELSETLEVREYKLMELGRDNAELYKRNTEMKVQLEAKKKRDECIEVSTVTEEYTQRMSALEKKFQQSIRERDNLRDQLKVARSDLSDKVSRETFDKDISEKNFMIQELKTEGEKLSIQILQHSNIIKKLRAKEKETDATLRKQKEEIEGFVEETERLKKSLSAKDEVERSQIEAVHKLSSEKRKLEKENGQLKSQLDDTLQKLDTVQTSFDAAKKELADKQEANLKLSKKTETFTSMESEKQLIQSQNQQFINEMASLREKLRQVEHGNHKKEQQLRQENLQLMHRLEESEMRAEQQAQSVTESTIPLVRQLESLQSTLNQRTNAWENQERIFLEKLNESQRQLERLQNYEDKSNEKLQTIQAKLQNAEDRVAAEYARCKELIGQQQEKDVNFELLEIELKRQIENLRLENQQLRDNAEDSHRQIDELQQQRGEAQRELLVIAEKKNQSDSLMASSQQQQQQIQEICTGDDPLSRQDSSPTLSVGHASLADSLSSNMWPLEDIDCISNSGRPSCPSLYGSSGFAPPMHTTSYLENLQATLKQRDGENHQLQWELSRLQTDRNFLMSEVSNLTMELESFKEKLAQNDRIVDQFAQLQHKHDLLTRLHSEKLERLQELQMDLVDAKEVYKSQIDDLLRQLKEK